jgi:putative peptidoglycan lipid II flippase
MILKNSALLAVFSVLSVLLGIVRDRLLAVYVGVGPVLDVYNASFRIPDLIYGVFLAFITAGTVVPFLTRENKDGKIIESEKRFTSLLFFFSVMMSVLIIFVMFTISLYAKFIVPGFTDEQLSLFIFATRLLMFQPLFLGVSSLISCFAQLKNEFLYYGMAPLGYSLGIISGIVFFYKDFGVKGLIYGVLIGAIVSLLIQSISLRAHKFSIKRHNVRAMYVKELILFAFPRSFTNVISQLRVVFFTAFATTLGPGVLSSFLFAQRVTDALSQVISQSVTTASLPVLSREHEEGRIKQHEALVYKYTSVLFFGAIVLAVCVYPLRHIVVAILYSHNAANNLIATFLVGFLVALPFSMASSYLAIGFYSMKDTKKVFFGNLAGTVASILTCFFFRDLGIASLMYGIIVYYFTSSVLYAILYKRSHFLARSRDVLGKR